MELTIFDYAIISVPLVFFLTLCIATIIDPNH